MHLFLEPHWLDVRSALISEARSALNRSLPGDLIASGSALITPSRVSCRLPLDPPLSDADAARVGDLLATKRGG